MRAWKASGAFEKKQALGQRRCVVFLGTQACKWVSVNLMLGGVGGWCWVYSGDGLASHPGGSGNIPSHFMLNKPRYAPA